MRATPEPAAGALLGARGEPRQRRPSAGTEPGRSCGPGPGLAACTAGPPGRAFPGEQKPGFVPARPGDEGQGAGGAARGAGKMRLGLEAELGRFFY